MDFLSRLLWYLGWNTRPLSIAAAVLALGGATFFHNSWGLVFGLFPMVVRWKAAQFVNNSSTTFVGLAKRAVAKAGAARVGVSLEQSQCTTLLIEEESDAPLGILPSSRYALTAVYVCDAFVAFYPGSSLDLAAQTIDLAATGEEVYFRHITGINQGEDAIEILVRSGKPKKIIVGNDPKATELLGLLRGRLRSLETNTPARVDREQNLRNLAQSVEDAGSSPASLEQVRRVPLALDSANHGEERYCYLRSSKLMEYYSDPSIVSALMDRLQVPGTAATHKLMSESERKAAIELQINHFGQTPTSFWYGSSAREILAASIWRMGGVELSRRVIADKFYEVAREEDLRRPIAKWLEARGEEPYMEIQLGRRRIDVLGYKKPGAIGSPRLTAVELKDSDEQFRRGPDQMGTFAEYTHAVYLACTPAFAADYLERNANHRSVNRWDATLLDRKLKQGGFGLLIVERDKVFEVIKPVEQSPSETKVEKVIARLPALHKIELD